MKAIPVKITEKMSFKDELTKFRFIVKVLIPVLLGLFLLNFVQVAATIFLYRENTKLMESKSERLVMVPIAGPGPIVIEGKNGQLDNSYILDAAIKIVGLQENWSWLNIESNYDQIYAYHASQEFENFLKANLAKTQFKENAKAHEMVSTFKLDRDRSRAAWCSKLNAACAVVYGHRNVFIKGNAPLAEGNVAYFIVSNVVYPTKEQPNALRIHRQIIADKGDDPSLIVEPMFNAAMNTGKLPEVQQ